MATTKTVAQRLDDLATSGLRLAFDGCHKIYVIRTDGEVEEAASWGYRPDDIYPASAIHDLWERSCFLRFVSEFSLADSEFAIEQGEVDDDE